MAQGFIRRLIMPQNKNKYTHTVSVQANPGATITLSSSDGSFSAVADSITGVAELAPNKLGTYSIATSSSATYDTMLNDAEIILEEDVDYSAQKVMVNYDITHFSAGITARAGYWSPHWISNPTSDFTGYRVGYATSAQPTLNSDGKTYGTHAYSGTGSTIYFYKESLTRIGTQISGSGTRYFVLQSYIDINGTRYWSAYTKFAQGTIETHNATVSGVANPGATITMTRTSGYYGSTSYTTTANSSTGAYSITLTEYGAFSIATNSSATYWCVGASTATCDHKTAGETFSRTLVKVNVGSVSSLSVSNAYQSNVLLPYWGTASTAPSSDFTCYRLGYSTSSMSATDYSSSSRGTGLYWTVGSSYQISSSSTVWGKTHTGLTTGTTYYYKLMAYYKINDVDYYAQKAWVASGTATTYASSTKQYTAAATTTVPTGIRKIVAYVVGGGGSGGCGSKYITMISKSTIRQKAGGGGGGGSGYYATKTYSTIPGQSIVVTIGSGGASKTGTVSYASISGSDDVTVIFNGAAGNAGSSSSVSINGVACTAAGGSAGGAATSNSSAGSGGSGWHAGGAGGLGTSTGSAGTAGAAVNGTTYAGGGGGGGGSYQESNYSGGSAGSGGGGAGGKGATTGSSATANTGSGGGGSGGYTVINQSSYSTTTSLKASGAGGSGRVILVMSSS